MTRRSRPLAEVIAVICLWLVITRRHGGFLWCERRPVHSDNVWTVLTSSELPPWWWNTLRHFPIQESHSFASATAAWEAAVREKCLSTKPVSKAADKVIKLRVTSTSLHQLITIHVACLHVLTGHVNTERHMWYSYLFWLCLSLNTVTLLTFNFKHCKYCGVFSKNVHTHARGDLLLKYVNHSSQWKSLVVFWPANQSRSIFACAWTPGTSADTERTKIYDIFTMGSLQCFMSNPWRILDPLSQQIISLSKADQLCAKPFSMHWYKRLLLSYS